MRAYALFRDRQVTAGELDCCPGHTEWPVPTRWQKGYKRGLRRRGRRIYKKKYRAHLRAALRKEYL